MKLLTFLLYTQIMCFGCSKRLFSKNHEVNQTPKRPGLRLDAVIQLSARFWSAPFFQASASFHLPKIRRINLKSHIKVYKFDLRE